MWLYNNLQYAYSLYTNSVGAEMLGRSSTRDEQKTPRVAVADPGFPRGGGANSPGGGDNIRCMKLKEFGPPGRGAHPLPPPTLDPPLGSAC